MAEVSLDPITHQKSPKPVVSGPTPASSQPGRVKQPPAPTTAPAHESAKTLKARQAQLDIESVSADEQAFITLLGITKVEFREIKAICNLKQTDRLTFLLSKVKGAKSGSAAVKKAKQNIKKYEQCQKYKEAILSTLKVQQPELFKTFESYQNKILARAFAETLALFRDERVFKEYYEILNKYHIIDPLAIGRKDIGKMTIYEETIFFQRTETMRGYSISNMYFEEAQRYLNIQEQIRAKTNKYFLQIIKSNKFGKKLAAIHNRETEAMAQLWPKDDLNLELTGLTNKAQSLINKYRKIAKELEAAIKTPDIKDDEMAKAKLSGIIDELLAEIGIEYKAAYVETPSNPEKQALKSLLHITAQLKILDKKIIYYARLSNPALSQNERDLIEQVKGLSEKGILFSKAPTEAGAFKKYTLAAWLATYPKEVQLILEIYVRSTKDFLRQIKDNMPLIGTGKDKSEALYFTLLASGFSEKELLAFDAMAALESLADDDKKVLIGTNEGQIGNCLKELKKTYDLMLSSKYITLSPKERAAINAKYCQLTSLLFGLVGSYQRASYLMEISVYMRKTGVHIPGKTHEIENSPETHDDLIYHQGLLRFIKASAEQFGVDPWNLIATHLTVRKITGEPIDQKYVDEILKHSSLQGLIDLDGQYNLDELKKKFISAFVYKGLESSLAIQTNYEASKAKIFAWLQKYVGQIRSEISKDPRYAGLNEMENKLRILNQIFRFLLETKVVSNNELDIFIKKNPYAELKIGLEMQNLRSKEVFFTMGYESLPKEVKDAVEKHGFTAFCKDYAALLDIYWVPNDKKTLFLGYTFLGKGPIVLTYKQSNFLNKIIDILVHELRHKADNDDFEKYCLANPNYKKPFDDIPIMLTERNADILSLAVCEGIKPRTLALKKEIAEIRRRVEISNVLLGLNPGDRQILKPPYNGIKIEMQSLSIAPSQIPLEVKDLHAIKSVLINMGYTAKEQGFLIDTCVAVISSGWIDLSTLNVPGQRNIFIDFIEKLVGDKRSKGYYTDEFESHLAHSKKTINSKVKTPIVTSQELKRLIYKTLPLAF
ncbi:hypothetical protein HZC34_01995 [Candidatus Saganbacteria bacterium]|nr:hypothetical protein [Candidatus Saganbacteria bacterium]